MTFQLIVKDTGTVVRTYHGQSYPEVWHDLPKKYQSHWYKLVQKEAI